MKKILFALFTVSIIFLACNSDNDLITQDTNFDPVKYTVNLNVKSAGFEVEKAPLKSTGWSEYSFLQIIVYKESGEVYSDSIIDPTALAALIAENNTPQISLSLPKGNYYLSLFNATTYDPYYPTISDMKINPNNYETDYFQPKSSTIRYIGSNSNIYYYTSSLNIGADSNTKDIVLEPMWSRVTSINTIKSPTFKYPEGVDFDIYQIPSRYYGFGIKSKLAKTPDANVYVEFQYYDPSPPIGFHYVHELPAIISKSEDKNFYLDVCYIKYDNYSGARITKIQRIKLPIEIENGMNYTISGTIPDIDNIDSGVLNISTEPFKDSNISFQ